MTSTRRPLHWHLLVLTSVCILALFCRPAAAHEGRPIIAELVLSPDGTAELMVTDDPVGLASLAGAPALSDGAGDDVVRARLEGVLDRIGAGILLSSDQGAVALHQTGMEVLQKAGISTVHIVFRAQVPSGATSLTWRLDGWLGESVIRVRRADEAEPFGAMFVNAGEVTAPLPIDAVGAASGLSVFADYLIVGFEHIVPLGLDHILFVVGLFLLSPRIRPLLWQVSMFTLAHTLTLALGLTGVVRLPGEIVEPLIAASIAFVAIDNLRGDRMGRYRPRVIFALGLLHGLGFAGVLSEYGLPPGHFVPALVAFNIGVEIGQLAVLAACFLAIGLWFRRHRLYRPVVVIPGSLAIMAVALFWVFERTGLVAL